MSQAIKINKYLPIILLYFFFNEVFLPHGLLYTTLLTPVFLVWLFNSRYINYLWTFFAVFVPLSLIHIYNGLEMFYFIKSFLLLFSIYVFSLAFYRFLQECHSLRSLMRNILLINIIFVLAALIALFIPALKSTFWYTIEITQNTGKIPRLQALTYEPSYYSTLLTPIALYYYLKMIILKLPDPKTIFVLLTVPLILSLSFGIIGGMILSLLFTVLAGLRSFFPDRNLPAYLMAGGILLIFLLGAALLIFPENILFVRISNVFNGYDNSFKGRTTDSFYLGWEIAKTKSIFFGVGLGQVKLIGLDFFKHFYNYGDFTIESIAIPNAVGDTLATFGIFGVLVRLGLEIWFFFRTRVFNNYYRLSLFIFIFIYQFTGSYIMNIAEYVIWIMAFHQGLFEEFDKPNFYRRSIQRPSSQP